MLAVAFSAGLCPLGVAQAQGLLPAYGTDVRVGDLRTQFARAFDTNPPVASERIWTFAPALGISETYDSGTLVGGRYTKDYITRVTPTLAVSADGQRIKGTFSYSPSFSYYAINGRQNGVAQNLNTNATATLVRELLFVDLRGYASTQPLLGGQATANGAGGQQNDVQTTSFSVTPYLQHRFGDTATLYVGLTGAQNTVTSVTPKGTTAALGGLNSKYMSKQERVALSSGPDFGRISASLEAMAIQYTGQGVYKGAHTETITASAGYALTRMVTLTAGIGHETIIYGPGGPKAIDGMTWNGGVRLTPNVDSTITASYGRSQGSTSFAFDGTYAATQRIRIMARYSQGIGTGLQNLQNAVAGSAVGPAGIPVDRISGAPVQLGNVLGQQSSVYRTTSASVNAVWQGDRDTITVGVEKTDRLQLSGGNAAATNLGFGSSNGVTNTLAWQHSFSEALRGGTSVQYGTRTVPRVGGQTTKTGTLTLNYALSETLSTNALISHSETVGKTFGLPPIRDTAVVGLNKAF